MQFNAITSTLDANWVYGGDKGLSDSLRLFDGGKMKTLPVFDEFGLKPLLPLKTEEPNDGCIRPRSDIYCFHAGKWKKQQQNITNGNYTHPEKYMLAARERLIPNHVNQSQTTFSMTSQIHQNLIPRKNLLAVENQKNTLKYKT